MAGRTLLQLPDGARDLVLRTSHFAQRTLVGADHLQPVTASATAAPFSTTVPITAPGGTTLDQLRTVFESWSVNGEPSGHMKGYLDDSFWRFLHTLGLVAGRAGTCLELGANPYFTTYLLMEHSALDLTLANFYGDQGRGTRTKEVLRYINMDGAPVEHLLESDLFNIEEDRFPYDDDSFDIVLFCEIIEHLLTDPVKVLGEIRRVLKPSGTLVLTTPNVCRLGNVFSIIAGANVYDPYSGFGPYGRHNREFTRHELHILLEFLGFDVETSFTADAHPADYQHQASFDSVANLVRFRQHDLGQYLFVRAIAARPPRHGLPDLFYRSWPEGSIVPTIEAPLA